MHHPPETLLHQQRKNRVPERPGWPSDARPIDHLKYRPFGPSRGSWAAYVSHQFDAGRPPPSRSIHILAHHGSDGKHFSRSMPEVAAGPGPVQPSP
ncbi:MAG: hypothetical protein EA424_06395 [Planctomycetaceae bacterium]|nr:MAG: hypothetical protein EA424_06395 [Planctomycetaceae bacterium]